MKLKEILEEGKQKLAALKATDGDHGDDSETAPLLLRAPSDPSNSNNGSRKWKKKESSPFPFLDLPSDIRIRVYDLLRDIPEHEGELDRHKKNKYHGFSKTRKSLLLTCKQINIEFTPHFFRSTTFCIRPSGPHTPDEFHRLLLDMDVAKLNNIRHIEYRNRKFKREDFDQLDKLRDYLLGAKLHLQTLNIVHGDYASRLRPYLRGPVALAYRVAHADRTLPAPNMNWAPFLGLEWGEVLSSLYPAVQFYFFEVSVYTRIMPQAEVLREYEHKGDGAFIRDGTGGFRLAFRRHRRDVDWWAVRFPVTEYPTPIDQDYLPDGPTLTGVLGPLVPPGFTMGSTSTS
ncbi:hypothetical protein KCU88_g3731, partial [Aureobasidium melanogenum]